MLIPRKPLTIIIGLLVLILVLLSYVSIIAPTISFWDCGEFIAAGSTFGIPHPPGNPLYVLLTNIASRLFFFVPDIALRINLVSAITGAFTALFTYLTLIRILDKALPSSALRRQLVIHIGAVVGALMAAFSNTIVAGSVEAEVNGPVLLPIMLCTWLVLIWSQSTSPLRDRLLVAIVFISFLGLGIHMYAMIILPSALLFVLMCDPSKRKDWRFIATVLMLGLVIYRISWFLWIGPIVLIATFLFTIFTKRHYIRWRFCLHIATAALLGFSLYLYIPIRSAMHPAIDMGHPATLKSFVDYLDRKQYGNQSMITRMFWRRGSFNNQFGIEGHIGFGGFYLTQFFKLDKNDTEQSLFRDGFFKGSRKLLLYLVPSVFLLFGWLYLLKRSRATAVFLICMTLSTTVGMVLYMNFADGTRPERRDYLAWKHSGRPGTAPAIQREVRVRDYFFITGFMYCGMGIGLGAAGVLQLLFASRRRRFRLCAPYFTVLVGLLPAVPMAFNLSENNRQGDTAAFAYAWNLLMSCEKDAILFTNGDNDTYPLWALQQTYGIRKDIRVAVLSLLNTSWYIKDCRDKTPHLPLRLTDDTINSISAELNPFSSDTQYHLNSANITVTLPSRNRKPYLLVQDKVILNTVDANAWKQPIYFTGITRNGIMGLEPYCIQQGMVYRVTDDTGGKGPRFDIVGTEYLLDSVYRLEDFTGRRSEKDETNAGMRYQMQQLILQTVQARLQQASILHQQLQSLHSHNPELISSPSFVALETQLRDNCEKGLGRLDSHDKLFGGNDQSRALRAALQQKRVMD